MVYGFVTGSLVDWGFVSWLCRRRGGEQGKDGREAGVRVGILLGYSIGVFGSMFELVPGERDAPACHLNLSELLR